MAWVATQNFREVDRLLSHSDPVATLHFKQLGADARPLLRYQASEFNRWLFHGWDNAQLIGGSAILFLLLFWSRENKMTLSGILLLLILAAIQRFVLTPEIIGLGRMLDFAPAGALTRSSVLSGPSSQRVTSLKLSQYSRAEVAAVRVSQ